MQNGNLWRKHPSNQRRDLNRWLKRGFRKSRSTITKNHVQNEAWDQKAGEAPETASKSHLQAEKGDQKAGEAPETASKPHLQAEEGDQKAGEAP